MPHLNSLMVDKSFCGMPLTMFNRAGCGTASCRPVQARPWAPVRQNLKPQSRGWWLICARTCT